MPRKGSKSHIKCSHFLWLLSQRSGVFYADGRSNEPPLGRHSLGTRDRDEALEALSQLDRIKAVELGLVTGKPLEPMPDRVLDLAEGWRLYIAHVCRPRVTGGAKPATNKRYHAVWDKFRQFAQARQLVTWNMIDDAVLSGYAAWLEDQEYAYATQYLELTTLKQALKWLAATGRITMPRLSLRIAKPRDTHTYCWTAEDVRAILEFCQNSPSLQWLRDICLALACTGLRISELAALRWSDIDLVTNVIRLTDESTLPARSIQHGRRQTKTGHSRSFPIHPDLRRVLETIPRAADGLVFHGPRGGRVKPDTIRRILVEDVLNKLDDTAKQKGNQGIGAGRLHSFRHYFCSVCANSGVPELMVMRWLGHRQSEMVHRYYHLHDKESQQYMEKVALNFPRQAVG